MVMFQHKEHSMQTVDQDDDNAEQLVWDALKHGHVQLLNSDVITGLIYCREHKENFFAGYVTKTGLGVDYLNIPEVELAKIVPASVVDIHWNASEATHCPKPLFKKEEFTDEEMKIIDDAFRNAGFEMETDD